MKKRTILTAAIAVLLVAVLVVGGSLAYFTDKDSATNTFTVGNVDITLKENFAQNSKLIPATGSAQAGKLVNGVTKEVYVKNTGSEAAYVRVHIAIPQILDNGDPAFDAGQNVLHFNYSSDSIGTGRWDWSKTTGTPYEGDWNYYETKINDIVYNVYVVTYESELTAEAETVNAMHQVYLDSTVTNADITNINATLGASWKMYVAAEAVQAAGFKDAFTALNTAFGVPGKYTVAFTD